MQIQINGWKKIYLFYGVIFFGMGLFGFVSNSRLTFFQLARFFLDDLSEELAEVGLLHSRESREVAVINPQMSPVVLFSRIDNGEPGYRAMVNQIYNRMAKKAKIVHYQVSGEEWLKSPYIKSLINENRLFIGVENFSALSPDQLNIVFTVPKMTAVKFFERLENQKPELPLFQLRQIDSQHKSFYGLNFVNPPVSLTHWMRVIDALLETWKQMNDREGNKV